jgi:predicted HTH transcriptional regulator
MEYENIDELINMGEGYHIEFKFSQFFTVTFSRLSQVKTPLKTPVKILNHLKDNPELTLAELADNIDRSLSAVERATAKLVKNGKLRYIGPKKGGYWEVLD